ncbi:acyltransferase family protein [Agromyces allii]|uniref:Acyltransferase family protein n=1 Tax=Agromyces allii TaxID=393607 RepID=A0ABP5C0B3_9MICO|nr:acyltransferase family protein [Agromyces allii]
MATERPGRPIAPRPQPPRGFRPDIQGLRAIAVLVVIAFHAGVPGFGGGYLGVDVFFVVSGFLIGGPLVATILETGRVDLAAFYARRARRILPAALVVTVATVIASVLIASPIRLAQIATDAAWAASSAVNIRFAMQETDYLNGTAPSPLQHFWSLGVEEQFYLLVPLLLIGLFALTRRSGRPAFALGLSILAASFAVCLVLGDSPWNFFSLATRAWELGAGIFAALAVARLSRLGIRATELLAILGATMIVLGIALGGLPEFPHPGVGTLVPVLGTAVLLAVGGTARGAGTLVARGLGLRPAVAIGTLSYSLYLVHWPLLSLAGESVDHVTTPTPIEVGALMLVAVVAAWLLHRFVELPFLRRADPASSRPRRSIVAGLAATAVVAGSLLAATPSLASVPLTSTRDAMSRAAEREPQGTPYVPRNVSPTLAGAVDDTGLLYENGCQQDKASAELVVCSFGQESSGPDATGATDVATVVLFGDSHAGRWFPAMQAAFAGQPVHLVTLTKSGCRSIESASTWADSPNASCSAWRTAAMAWIVDESPDLTVLADHLGRPVAGREDRYEQQWSAATASTLARFPDPTRVAVLAETPEFDVSPPICLARHPESADACDEPRTRAVNASAVRAVRSAAEAAGARFVDFTDWFCNAERCPTVIGNHLVYGDEHHVTATFSASMGPVVRDALLPSLGAVPR